MIYTVGHMGLYEKFLEKNPGATLPAGGMVWETAREADAYLAERPRGDEYAVYGVEADWQEDTESCPADSAAGQRFLTRPARMVIPGNIAG